MNSYEDIAMAEPDANIMPIEHVPGDSGAALFTVAGVAAAFGLASCCALPILLTSLGLGTAWMSSVATMAAPHRALLIGIGAPSLLGGAVLLWRQQRAAIKCGPAGACTPLYIRLATLAGLILGSLLLWAGYTYA